jgi:hypothetical protein
MNKSTRAVDFDTSTPLSASLRVGQLMDRELMRSCWRSLP